MSILNRNHRGRFGPLLLLTPWCRRSRAILWRTGLTSRTWAYSLEHHNAFFMYCDRSLPPFAIQKKYHTHPGSMAPCGVTPRAFFPRISSPDVSRTEREFARAQRGPGLSRGQFSAPPGPLQIVARRRLARVIHHHQAGHSPERAMEGRISREQNPRFSVIGRLQAFWTLKSGGFQRCALGLFPSPAPPRKKRLILHRALRVNFGSSCANELIQHHTHHRRESCGAIRPRGSPAHASGTARSRVISRSTAAAAARGSRRRC